MANSVADSIVELEARIASINTKIDKQENFRAIEEGSSMGRFRTEFTDINSLYKERDRLETRLITLRLGSL